jgi:hypothetical protein
MYKPHEIFEPPPVGARLWRYMDLTKLIALLDTKALYFARADLLGDAWEGATSRFNVITQRTRYAGIPDDMRLKIVETWSKVKREARFRTYISCWHMDQHESDAMWKLYMKDAGIAIQTTFERLQASMAEDQEHAVYVGKVRYIDYDAEEMPENNLYWPFLHKRASFRHENEVRAILPATMPLTTGLNSASTPPGVCVPVSIEQLIEKIFVAPMTPIWVTQVIQSVLERFGLRRTLQQSALSQDPAF